MQGQERKQPGAPFQFDQLDRIFKVLGHPTARGWPLIEQLPHWANNKENIRVKKPDWSANRLEAHLSEVLRHLGEAFARAGNGRPPVSIPKLTPAGIDLLQVGCMSKLDVTGSVGLNVAPSVCPPVCYAIFCCAAGGVDDLLMRCCHSKHAPAACYDSCSMLQIQVLEIEVRDKY